MKIGSMSVRRFISGLFLLAALLMLALGFTVFSKNLTGKSFVIYWLTCLLFTGVAAILALIDITVIRRKLQKEQRDLIQSTLNDAQIEKIKKPFSTSD
jgi:hypothetical protein